LEEKTTQYSTTPLWAIFFSLFILQRLVNKYIQSILIMLFGTYGCVRVVFLYTYFGRDLKLAYIYYDKSF